eukprot:gene23570-biopygen13380
MTFQVGWPHDDAAQRARHALLAASPLVGAQAAGFRLEHVTRGGGVAMTAEIERVSNACHRDEVAALAAAGKQADRITGRAVARRGSEKGTGGKERGTVERVPFFETRSQKHKNGTRCKRIKIRTRFLTRFERVPETRLGRVTMCP